MVNRLHETEIQSIKQRNQIGQKVVTEAQNHQNPVRFPAIVNYLVARPLNPQNQIVIVHVVQIKNRNPVVVHDEKLY